MIFWHHFFAETRDFPKIIHLMSILVDVATCSKTIKRNWTFGPLFLLSARRKEVTSITSSTSSQFTVEFIKELVERYCCWYEDLRLRVLFESYTADHGGYK